MFERLHQYNMTMNKSGIVLFKKVDIKSVENYEAVMMLLTRIKEHLVLKTMPSLSEFGVHLGSGADCRDKLGVRCVHMPLILGLQLIHHAVVLHGEGLGLIQLIGNGACQLLSLICQAIQYQYNTRTPVLQYNTNVIPMQY